MGRLIDPMTPEEWEKLPAGQKWLSRYWYIPMIVLAVFFVALYFLTR